MSYGNMNHTFRHPSNESSPVQIFKLISIPFEHVLLSVNRGWGKRSYNDHFCQSEQGGEKKVSVCELAPEMLAVIAHLPLVSSGADSVFMQSKCISDKEAAGQRLSGQSRY